MKRCARAWALCVFFVACQFPGHAAAEEKPLWEFGLGVFSIALPAYRGAVETLNEALPIPYLIYRGEHFKADKDGVRGVLFDTDQFEVNLSVAASPPVSSHNVAVRQGMPDLNSSVELGPSVDLKLWRSAGNDVNVKLFLPVRAAMTLESDPQFIGWQFTPRINIDVDNPLGLRGWTLAMLGGPVFGSREQHDYFYGVAPQFANPQRPAYDARPGYAGMQFTSALWKRFPSFWMGGFVRYDNLRGAVFENSPLVTQKSGFAGGVAISWIFSESSQKVSGY
jgi:outer membrane scaffolding protein for murein synthesis (MipA/OmpV family)